MSTKIDTIHLKATKTTVLIKYYLMIENQQAIIRLRRNLNVPGRRITLAGKPKELRTQLVAGVKNQHVKTSTELTRIRVIRIRNLFAPNVLTKNKVRKRMASASTNGYGNTSE